MENKIDNLRIFKIILGALIIENVFISISLVLAVVKSFTLGMIWLNSVYSQDVVTLQSVFNFLLIVSAVILIYKKQFQQKRKGVLLALMAFINIYLIYICMFVSTPDIFTAESFWRATLQFIKTVTLGL